MPFLEVVESWRLVMLWCSSPRLWKRSPARCSEGWTRPTFMATGSRDQGSGQSHGSDSNGSETQW